MREDAKEVLKLPPSVMQRARRAYASLYRRALPHAGRLHLHRIEVATFNRSSTWAQFRRIGLGLETVVIHREGDGHGHTGKVLMNLPWQLLPEHRHVDTYVLRPDAPIPTGYLPLRELVREFRGIRAYAPNGQPMSRNGRPVYLYPDAKWVIIQPEDDAAPLTPDTPGLVARYPAKSETFKAIYGDGILLHKGARVLYAPPAARPNRIPKGLRDALNRVRDTEPITTDDGIHMVPGVEVLLPGGTRHAFLAGPRGAVYLEFSAPSMDEADRFTDPRIIR